MATISQAASRTPNLKQETISVTYARERLSEDVNLELIRVPAGVFEMGSPEGEEERSKAEGPQHEVSVPEFWMGQYPVTQAQWRVVAGFAPVNSEVELKPNPSEFKDREDSDRRPVESVSWDEAVEFCARLSQKTGRPYRLPSEAEWEYACRAGTTTPFYFGPTLDAAYANYDAELSYGPGETGEWRKETVPVDYFNIANGFGLCDMHGNVFEWCQDHWHEDYEGAPSDGRAWLEDPLQNNRRVIRGGSWNGNPGGCRSAYRPLFTPVNRLSILGFRVVLAPP